MATKNLNLSPKEQTEIKLQLLSYGVSFGPGFLDAYPIDFIEKRWAYGNSDELHFQQRIPQEIILGKIIVAVHQDKDSSWSLENKAGNFLLCNKNVEIPITFPKRPKFYDLNLSNGTACREVGTLYGGGSLGIFSLGTCYYFKIDKQCGFCSLEPTRSTHGDHLLEIKPEIAAELVRVVLENDGNLIRQVMLNGGNRSNNDIGFMKHIETLHLLCKEFSKNNNKAELHLITMPPDDLDLINELEGLPVKVSMNLEVFSPDAFRIVAPGKASLYGQKKILDALEKTVNILGTGNVYTIFVGGLEPIETLSQGLKTVAAKGIVPIINIFHRDPKARFANRPRVSVNEMRAMGKELQDIFSMYKYQPFYTDCGRNSIDSEAYYGYFD